jgi:hypothetical protein
MFLGTLDVVTVLKAGRKTAKVKSRSFITKLCSSQCHQYFYEQLFNTKVFFAVFLYLQFGFVIFCQKNISAKAARKLLVKLTTGIKLCEKFNFNWTGVTLKQTWATLLLARRPN